MILGSVQDALLWELPTIAVLVGAAVCWIVVTWSNQSSAKQRSLPPRGGTIRLAAKRPEDRINCRLTEHQAGSRFDIERINHAEAYSSDRVCTNKAESFFARMRCGEIGHHHRLAGTYLVNYAKEAAWRENNRRVCNGGQVSRVVTLALASRPSVDFSGYWQRAS